MEEYHSHGRNWNGKRYTLEVQYKLPNCHYQHLGYMKIDFPYKEQAVAYFEKHNPKLRMRKGCSDVDKANIRFVVRSSNLIYATYPTFEQDRKYMVEKSKNNMIKEKKKETEQRATLEASYADEIAKLSDIDLVEFWKTNRDKYGDHPSKFRDDLHEINYIFCCEKLDSLAV